MQVLSEALEKPYIYFNMTSFRKKAIVNTGLYARLIRFMFLLWFCLISFGHLNAQIQYVRNDGQWDEHIKFKADLSGGYMFAENNRLTYVISEADQIEHVHGDESELVVGHSGDEILGAFAYQVEFLNSSPLVTTLGSSAFSHYHNYFTDANPDRWRSHVPVFEDVYYQDLYMGIDMRLHSKGDFPEYDLIVHPGSDVTDIKLRYQGVEQLQLNDGKLQFQTPLGAVTEMEPVAYQHTFSGRKEIKSRFVKLSDNEIGFEMLEAYDPQQELIIDPVLIFSTYSGSFSDNWGFTATYDNHGNLYSGGMARNQGYPTTVGSYDTIYNGGVNFVPTDIVVSKFNTDGTDLIYSTYIGGIENEIPHSIIVNDRDELIIYGTTGSADYPVTAGAYDVSFNGGTGAFPPSSIDYPNGSDIVITKLNSDGSNLLGSTFFGGNANDGVNLSNRDGIQYNYGDFARGDLVIADNFDIVVASCTYSSDLEVSGASFQSVKDAGLGGLIFRLNDDLTSLTWATYLGGSGDDAAYSIELSGEEVIIAGGTTSPDMPGMVGLNDTYSGGQADGYLIKLNQDGTSSSAGTYLGTDAYDQAYFLEIDNNGNIYAFGQTLGDYEVSQGVFSNLNATQFIHKLNNSLTESRFSTVFGSSYLGPDDRRVNISPTAFLVDNCNNIYTIGWGGSVNQSYNGNAGTTFSMDLTSDAYQTNTDGSDFYFLVLDAGATNLLYATYFGEIGGRGDHVDGGTSRFDKNGFVYHANCASCGGTDGFPTTPGAWSDSNNSANCNMGLFKFEFDFAPIRAESQADPIAGCPPLAVEFSNFSNFDGEYYYWDFDDGETSTVEEPTHVFTEPGNYEVQFVIIDSSNCLIADTAYIEIIVSDSLNETVALFDISANSCTQSNITFSNLSENAGAYLWDFGNGSTSTEFEPVYSYGDTGTFIISLVADPGSFCSDSFSIPVQILESNIDVDFSFSQNSCSDSTGTIEFLDLTGSSQPITDWFWDLGDGNTSTSQNPAYEYGVSGDFDVILTVTDQTGCFDFATMPIEVSTEPFEALFEVVPNCDPIALGVQFIDLSGMNSNVVSWQWDFGDSTFSSEMNPNHFFPSEDVYSVTLIATNELGCTDTIIQSVNVFSEQIQVTFTVDSLECYDPTTSFVNTTVADSIVEWIWDFGDGSTSNEENPVHTYSSPGFYVVTLTAVSVTGCESSWINFVSHPDLDVDFTITPATVCDNVGLPFNFIVGGNSSSTVTQYDWIFGDGNFQNMTFNTTHTYDTAGDYTVEFIIANQEGCVDTIRHPVFVRDSLQASIDAVQAACILGELSVSFNATTDVPDPITQINWDFGDGTMISGEVAPDHEYADTGAYQVIVDLVTGSGCTASTSLELQVVIENATADFMYDNPPCNNYNSLFFDQSVAGTEPIVQWIWDFGDGTTDTIMDPSHTFPGPGTYNVSLTIVTESGCVFNTSQPVTFAEESVDLVDELDICSGDSIRLPLTGSFGDFYFWSPAEGLSDNLVQQPIASPQATTTYFVTVSGIVSNGDTCRLVESVTVNVNQSANVEASADQYLVDAGTTIQLDATDGFETYVWTPAAEVSDPSIQDPTSIITEDITFEVSVTDADNCANTDTVTILVADPEVCLFESLFIPNAFSPNNDGLNDQLTVQIEGEYDRFEFRITDRWGTLVFQATEVNESWDGMLDGKLLSGDAFGFYLEIECQGETLIRQGNITLLR
ncbi:MAG: PKD domain-containing protein [Bacteroidetes bacterium]|nr:PKD domain-containing protein [Bacteroidota bacterium]